MIRKTLKNLKESRVLIKKTNVLIREDFALAHLNQLLPKPYFLPITSWSMAPSAIVFILNDILINKRKNIIEFGSGLSTVFIALLIEQHKLDIQFISIDNNEEWILHQNRILKDLDCEKQVKFVYAPLNTVDQSIKLKTQHTWYETKPLFPFLSGPTWDLIIVDGPKGSLCDYSRFSAIPFFKDHLSDNFTVLLDDTNRKDEQIITEEWKRILGIPYETYGRYTVFQSGNTLKNTPFVY
ncbi:hypothetical protein [Ascidiimonas aurantiaca]|uniref:hypothetical protein n=1 Tax=Ascidiimonas aurantiaca TaxID=1685432 RepID=UPI0030EF493F